MLKISNFFLQLTIFPTPTWTPPPVALFPIAYKKGKFRFLSFGIGIIPFSFTKVSKRMKWIDFTLMKKKVSASLRTRIVAPTCVMFVVHVQRVNIRPKRVTSSNHYYIRSKLEKKTSWQQGVSITHWTFKFWFGVLLFSLPPCLATSFKYPTLTFLSVNIHSILFELFKSIILLPRDLVCSFHSKVFSYLRYFQLRVQWSFHQQHCFWPENENLGGLQFNYFYCSYNISDSSLEETISCIVTICLKIIEKEGHITSTNRNYSSFTIFPTPSWLSLPSITFPLA